MKNLYVAGQDEITREWIPVAELRQLEDGYDLRFTNGAQRLPNFSGLGRMQSLDKVYYSRALFPFFANRLLSKSRPEYKSYIKWLGLDGIDGNAMDVLSVTAGVRATDSYELVATPNFAGNILHLKFFPRGLRYLSSNILEILMRQPEGSKVFLMRDLQNEKDPNALALRTETPSATLIGYVPRYYCPGICRLLSGEATSVQATIERVNQDAPLDMKILISLKAEVQNSFELFDGVNDFTPLTSAHAGQISENALQKTDLNL